MADPLFSPLDDSTPKHMIVCGASTSRALAQSHDFRRDNLSCMRPARKGTGPGATPAPRTPSASPAQSIRGLTAAAASPAEPASGRDRWVRAENGQVGYGRRVEVRPCVGCRTLRLEHPRPHSATPSPPPLVGYRGGKRVCLIRVRIQILVPVASSLYWASVPDGS